MKVALLRVGIDSGSGGTQGPLFSDHSFEFIPIPDDSATDDRTYGNTMGRTGRPLVDFLPKRLQSRMMSQAMHVDPEFETFTYGDPTPPKAGLRRLEAGDLLVFYAGLQGWECGVPPALYLIGYFLVEFAGKARELSPKIVKAAFAGNFHVRHPHVFASQRDRLVLVKGGKGSKLLKKAICISVPASSPPGHMVLSTKMRAIFGDLNGKPDITRSPTRWIESGHIGSAYDYCSALS
jgi:hypothetical protein